jgi:hypothetical protein
VQQETRRTGNARAARDTSSISSMDLIDYLRFGYLGAALGVRNASILHRTNM